MVMHTKYSGAEYLDANEGLTRVYNLPKLMSSANRKEFKNIDDSGNAQLYTVGMRMYGSDVQCVAGTAPNTYVTRRAVKAWHDARVKMYKRAGISMKSLGYGRTLRPYLDVNHQNGTTTEIDTEIDLVGTDASGIVPGFTGDEWTYSQAAVATAAEEGHTTSVLERDLVDTYHFTLCGDNVEATSENNTTENFTSVGMLRSWIGSFKKKIPSATDTSKVDEDNPLLQLVSQQGADKEEVLELAAEGQKEARPWDLGGATHYSTTVQAYFQSQTGESSYQVFQIPCGLFSLVFANGATAQGVRFDIDVLDIQDM